MTSLQLFNESYRRGSIILVEILKAWNIPIFQRFSTCYYESFINVLQLRVPQKAIIWHVGMPPIFSTFKGCPEPQQVEKHC